MLREIVKNPLVEKVTLCEIDEAVIRLSKLYLPDMAAGFFHPKVEVFVGDGFKFLEDNKNSYDVHNFFVQLSNFIGYYHRFIGSCWSSGGIVST